MCDKIIYLPIGTQSNEPYLGILSAFRIYFKTLSILIKHFKCPQNYRITSEKLFPNSLPISCP